MQTVAAAPDSPVAPSAPATVRVGVSGTAAPFLDGTYVESLGLARGHPALPDDEWDDNATDEERAAAFGAAVQEGFGAHEKGDYVKVPAGRLGDFLNEIGERASQRLRAKRAHAQ